MSAPTSYRSELTEVSPDAELLRLGDRLGQAWADEIRQDLALNGREDDEARRLSLAGFQRVGVVVDEIATLRATTLAGLGVLALAFCWSSDSDLSDDVDFTDYDQFLDRVHASIRRGLVVAKPEISGAAGVAGAGGGL